MHHILGQPLDTITEQHIKDDQAPIQDLLPSEPAHQLGSFLRPFKSLNDQLQMGVNLGVDEYRKLVVNTRYYYSQTLEELEKLESQQIGVKVHGMSKEELCAHLRDLRQESLLEENWNISHMLLNITGDVLQYPMPRLFLVLPDNLHSWNDSDPTSNKFRVHFLCDNHQYRQWDDEKGEHSSEDMLYVHLSNHPGYNLKRPQEFFQSYGDYVLRVLQMVESGYRDRQYFVPPLVTTDTIGSLVAKAIAYLQEEYPPKSIIAPKLNRTHLAALKMYLDVQDGDNVESDLHRQIRLSFRPSDIINDVDDFPGMYWKCKRHAKQYLKKLSMVNLMDFVQSHGGQIDMQYAKLKVELSSEDDASQFFLLLNDTNYAFDLSIKLKWNATRSFMKQLCQVIAETRTTILELDGITLDMLPQDYVLDTPLNNTILGDMFSRVIILHNYPRPEKHSCFFDNFTLLLSSSPVHSNIDWMELSDIAKKFEHSVSISQAASEYNKAAREIKEALEDNGLTAATAITVVNHEKNRMSWFGTFDLKEYTMVEGCSINMAGQDAMLSSGSLRTLTVYLQDPHENKELFDLVNANTLLQDLNVSCYGCTILSYFEYIVRMWLHSSTTSRLTLVDRMTDTHGRVLARLARRSGSQTPVSKVILDANTYPSSCQQQTSVPASVEFLQWDCDGVFYQLANYSVSILDMATDQHPSVLVLFTLDISQLTCHGFITVQKILRRSHLECLTIVCTHIDANISDSVAQVLGSVQWSILKSLKLLGNHIDTWASLWMSSHSNPFTRATCDGPRLLFLHLQSTQSMPQILSHTSALFVHGLVYSSASVEVLLKNVILVEKFT